MSVYRVAEKFKSVQGEGVYAGTPMAFIRFVGCSVGKRICQHCDTDFDSTMPWRGGGEFSHHDLLEWAAPYEHICLTGGEPFDQDLPDLLTLAHSLRHLVHIETSGTRLPPNPNSDVASIPDDRMWVCVSPKPGFLEQMVRMADEVKVIVPGLGEINEKEPKHWSHGRLPIAGDEYQRADANILKRWPTLEDALRWAKMGKIVFLQPRNAKNDVDKTNLMYVQDLVRDYPQLRLSVQLHKILKVQ